MALDPNYGDYAMMGPKMNLQQMQQQMMRTGGGAPPMMSEKTKRTVLIVVCATLAGCVLMAMNSKKSPAPPAPTTMVQTVTAAPATAAKALGERMLGFASAVGGLFSGGGGGGKPTGYATPFASLGTEPYRYLGYNDNGTLQRKNNDEDIPSSRGPTNAMGALGLIGAMGTEANLISDTYGNAYNSSASSGRDVPDTRQAAPVFNSDQDEGKQQLSTVYGSAYAPPASNSITDPVRANAASSVTASSGSGTVDQTYAYKA